MSHPCLSLFAALLCTLSFTTAAAETDSDQVATTGDNTEAIIGSLQTLFADRNNPPELEAVQPVLTRIDNLVAASDDPWQPEVVQLAMLKAQVYQILEQHDQSIAVIEGLVDAAPADNDDLQLFLTSSYIDSLRRAERMEQAITVATSFWERLRDQQHAAAGEAAMILARMLAEAGETEALDKLRQEAVALPNAPEELGASIEGLVMQAKLQPGNVFPPFSVTGIDGQALNLEDFRGSTVLIDFWATWCGPCVAELPTVKEAYNRFHDQGFDIIGISLDQERDKLDQFIAEHQLPWRQFFDGQGWSNELARRYGISSIPATYLIDSEGVIIGRDLRGPALIEAVEAAIAERSDAAP